MAAVVAPAGAVDSVQLEMGSLEGEGFRIESLRLVLQPGAERHALALHADAVYLAEGVELQAVRVDCPALRLRGLGGECQEARIRFRHAWLGDQTLSGSFRYAHPGRLDLQVTGLQLAGGNVRAHVRVQGERWAVDAGGEALSLEGLAALSAQAGQPWPILAQGRSRLALSARGAGALPDRLDLTLDLEDGVFASEDGLRAGEGLAGSVSAAWERDGGSYRLQLTADWREGGIYLHPVFAEAGESPVELSLAGRMEPAAARLSVDRLDLRQAGVITLAGRGAWTLGQGLAGLQASIEVDRVDLPAAYDMYARPFLPGTALDALDTGGVLAGRLEVHNGEPAEVVVNAAATSLEDRLGRFAVHGLDTALHWRADGTAPLSRVSVERGHVYGIPVGRTRFQPVIGRDGFRLPEPVRVPVLDGGLDIRDLHVEGIGSGDARWQFDGGLTPISMERLTAALGWPRLSGSLAGIIPDVRYEQGLLSVGGRLLVRAFDGTVTLGDVRLRDPLGVAPEFSAQIRIRNMDLEQITRTFDFGRITGRLEGDVRDLVLVRWSPVQFDAVLRTPPGDTSPRRISQRAVDNLTRVGGGVGGIFSGGFLRFFEEFNYRRLGLSCRLVGEVCYMDGVAPAEHGYYIVQGSGLPRIDVMGFTREVAWRDLVARLATVMLEGGEPVVR
ncbi:hypothetical protein B1C78_07900 [Thioalkalivibrio denitrificans]|uniref:Dicarboxylate transport domain-containing protein n=2 Tax=Thioalkalivibrio denitrificans TaxID=108003 RepID=A0A1V3NIV6_9GAMM|nr:hypothetical protein B1C78_07900 [Thioalkalivibrio denitrificans]